MTKRITDAVNALTAGAGSLTLHYKVAGGTSFADKLKLDAHGMVQEAYDLLPGGEGPPMSEQYPDFFKGVRGASVHHYIQATINHANHQPPNQPVETVTVELPDSRWEIFKVEDA